jgi:alpha-D-xyloside xylohydrolase
LYSGKWYAGAQEINADADYERMPVFVKAGSIIPFGPELQYTTEKPADTIMLNVYSGQTLLSICMKMKEQIIITRKKLSLSFPININEATKDINDKRSQRIFQWNVRKKSF